MVCKQRLFQHLRGTDMDFTDQELADMSAADCIKKAYYEMQKDLMAIDMELSDEGADRENASDHPENSRTFWHIMFASAIDAAEMRAEERGIKLPEHLRR